MGVNISTNMNLPIPQVGSEAGPQYAQDVNNCLTLVDQHNHSPGYGTQINPTGIDINADLAMNNNNLVTARSVRFTSQPAALMGVADIGCLYEAVNDLYFNDGLGNNIRITQGGGVAGTPGSIANLVPPASVAYIALNQTVVFQSDVNTTANLDAGYIILRTSAVSSPGLTLQAPASISSNYTLSLPLVPLSTLPMFLDSLGNMSTGLITTSVITNASVTRPKLAAVGQQISASCGNFSTTSATPVDVTNLTVTITTSGRPVMVMCQGDGSGASGPFASGGSISIYLLRGATILSQGNYNLLSLPPSCVLYLDAVAAGTYTYKVQVSTSNTAVAGSMVLVAYEL